MTKTAKIVEIVKLGEHQYEGKPIYDTTMKLDNGDEGTCSKGKQNFFSVGQEITYTLTENAQYGNKIKLEQTQQTKQFKGSYQKEDPIERFIGFSASYAKDLIESGKVELKDFETTADMFLNWMTKKHSQNRPVQAPQAQQTTPVAQSSASEFIEYIKTLEPMPLPTKPVDDDLPF